MFYRRKIILSLFELYNNQLDKISLQKLLFLATNQQKKPNYDFVPYKYGCYSYSANADLKAMVRKGILSETESHFEYVDKTNYFKSLNELDKKILLETKALYGKMSANELMKHTYVNFPYWATKSIKAKEILSIQELKKVEKSKPKSNKVVLFTIGYEGISLEEYLNRLIKNGVKVLVDVRNNPLSMKFGFSKTLLTRYCESLGILYKHIPEVGIQSAQRQELNRQADYDKLFTDYRKSNLTKTIDSQVQILNLLEEHKRIALTCFEADICQCHRKPLAEAIEQLPDFNYTVKHI
jgi:uncharacterized protein (DUF488 family)